MPEKYHVRVIGSERKLQTKLDLWDRFQTADGFFPGLLRFGVAASIVGSVLYAGYFAGGATVPVSWTASDDEAIRGYEVQVSYDAGRTWHVAMTDLPAAATSLGLAMPAGTGPGASGRLAVYERLRLEAVANSMLGV